MTAILATTVCTTASASDYYNAIAELKQIRTFIADGLYLEAIRDSENTIAWHSLSSEDIAIFQGYKNYAEEKYNEYLQKPAQKSYYNAITEVNQIRNKINQGLYYEAITDCENTIAWHDLSPEDVDLINDLKTTANIKLTGYLQSSSKDDWSGAYSGRSSEAEEAINDITSMWGGMFNSDTRQDNGEITIARAKEIAKQANPGFTVSSALTTTYKGIDCYAIGLKTFNGKSKVEKEVYVNRYTGVIVK